MSLQFYSSMNPNDILFSIDNLDLEEFTYIHGIRHTYDNNGDIVYKMPWKLFMDIWSKKSSYKPTFLKLANNRDYEIALDMPILGAAVILMDDGNFYPIVPDLIQLQDDTDIKIIFRNMHPPSDYTDMDKPNTTAQSAVYGRENFLTMDNKYTAPQSAVYGRENFLTMDNKHIVPQSAVYGRENFLTMDNNSDMNDTFNKFLFILGLILIFYLIFYFTKKNKSDN